MFLNKISCVWIQDSNKSRDEWIDSDSKRNNSNSFLVGTRTSGSRIGYCSCWIRCILVYIRPYSGILCIVFVLSHIEHLHFRPILLIHLILQRGRMDISRRQNYWMYDKLMAINREGLIRGKYRIPNYKSKIHCSESAWCIPNIGNNVHDYASNRTHFHYRSKKYRQFLLFNVWVQLN